MSGWIGVVGLRLAGPRGWATLLLGACALGVWLVACEARKTPAPAPDAGLAPTLDAGLDVGLTTPPSRPTPSLAAHAELGAGLGNGVALLDPAGRSFLAVAARGAGGELFGVDADGKVQRLKTSAKELGGLYALEGQTLAALDFGGASVVWIGFEGGALVERGAVEVGPKPRLLEPHGAQVWVLTQDEARPLARLERGGQALAKVALAGCGPADLELAGQMLWVACVESHELRGLDPLTGEERARLPTEPRPYRVVRDGDQLVVLHTGQAKLSRVDARAAKLLQTQTLPWTPNKVAGGAQGKAWFLGAGAGRLWLGGAEGQELEVPVGSADAAWLSAPGSLWVVTGDDGRLLWRKPEVSAWDEQALGFVAGRLLASPQGGGLWVLGTSSGRVARYTVE